mmetsp:Transcript_27808/g.33749  ORF Transcript_27808/g.33749 Transcript_27808/m.33749 type:complete len:296 (-) Transcript_27808:48-935(-)|eukprot:CAMPEP_0197868484 /NCGR_PEP_ID=MMETSP1438-20131217/45309_1 /TAXON_ID=1461541 /ORGANISM="Pterosperma sp., Strain CCMP1384" /LENGTH=295 /DNA_ID=CAMNT_0043487193 /DNA_START=138 /DNA_END=1025 /DNA_ORIENTATION=+
MTTPLITSKVRPVSAQLRGTSEQTAHTRSPTPTILLTKHHRHRMAISDLKRPGTCPAVKVGLKSKGREWKRAQPAQAIFRSGDTLPVCASEAQEDHQTLMPTSRDFTSNEPMAAQVPRRAVLLACIGVLSANPSTVNAEGVELVERIEGVGSVVAAQNSLVLVHYVGRIAGTDTVFDSTRGGLRYIDGGMGVNRPIILRLNGDPVPGICDGLVEGIKGMVGGERRYIRVPPSLGFGSSALVGPYAAIPADSQLEYEIEVLRVSNLGPDALMKDIANCGVGGAGAADSGCEDIVPM